MSQAHQFNYKHALAHFDAQALLFFFASQPDNGWLWQRPWSMGKENP
jgi:hypothetical protein